MTTVDSTNDPSLRSWVSSANAGGDFPIQNLPYARFRREGTQDSGRIGVAIGDQVLDLQLVLVKRALAEDLLPLLMPLAAGDLNGFMVLGPAAWARMRGALSAALAAGSAQQAALESCLVPMAQAEFSLPCTIGDYSDFFTGIHHAIGVGKLFRPDNPLLPNYKWVPIGYHGRASSLVVSGTPIHRPNGQVKAMTAPIQEPPAFGPSQRLDYELEMGVLVGTGNAMGEPVPMAQAESRLFGMVLLNDWSARDVQAFEYQPLGPFLAKSFGTTLSPWVVTMQALAPFRRPFARPEGDPQPLPYLDSAENRARGGLDIVLETWLQTSTMRAAGQGPVRLMQSNFRHSYWTVAQLLTHQTSNGCNLNPGDLLGTGTQSGPEPGQGGSLLELSNGGKAPIALPGGEQRSFLQDGDTLELRAHCEAPGAVRIGFGPCEGTILPAV